MFGIKKFLLGLKIVPKIASTADAKGELEVIDSTGKLGYHNGTSVSPVVTESHSATLTNKTIVAASNTITTAASGNLVATNLNAALAELDLDIGNVFSDLGAHVTDTIDAHDASAISSIPSGNLAATDVQGAVNELQSDVDTRATSAQLTTHAGLTTGTHGVAGTIVGTSDSQALTNKTIDADLNTISNIENADIKAGAAIAVNKLAAQTVSRALASDASGFITPSATTSTELGFVSGVTSAIQTQLNSKVNASGGTLTNGSIVTPVRSDVKQDTKANLTTYASTASNGQLVFATDTKELFQVVDSALKAAGGTGAADVNALLIQTFDTSALSDFTQTGLSLTGTNTINGAQSAGLTHQAAINQSFKQTISVDRKFRSQQMTLSLSVRSTATSGNLTVQVQDETNAVSVLASSQIATSSNPFTANTNSNTTLNSISNADMAFLSVGDAVTGSGIPVGAVITAIGTNQVTISAAATATASAVSMRASALPTRRPFTFVIPANCASLSYTVTALPEANSPRSVVDDVVIELTSNSLLETSVTMPNITAWQGYTPTFQGFGTPTAVEFEWRQVGENAEIRGKFLAGTATSVEARIGLPAGLTSAGTGLIPSIQKVGTGAIDYSATTYFNTAILIEPSVTYVTIGQQLSNVSEFTKRTGTLATPGLGLAFSLFASIPCTGLSATSTVAIPLTQSGIVQEADFELRAAGNAGQAITLSVTNIPFIAVSTLGSAGSWNGSQFTVINSGVYNFKGSYATTTAGQPRISIYENGTLTKWVGAGEISDNVHTFSYVGYFTAGQVISFRADQSQTLTNNTQFHYLNITYQGSLKQVTVNTNSKITIPTSELRFEGASARGSTDTFIVKFDTMTKIRGDAFTVVSDATSGTKITMLKAGKLDVSASLAKTLATNYIAITKNQANLTAFATVSEVVATGYISTTGNVATFVPNISTSMIVQVGDIIRVCANTAPTADAVTNMFNLLFQEQDIQVSVSNTLPQFSESDSSVRLDTANGYGSTNTVIRRFSNVTFTTGSDVSYVDSATNGATFTAQSSGIYTISYTDSFSGAANMGLSKNSTQLTTSISTITVSDRLTNATTPAANFNTTVSWTGYLALGDIIRAHNDTSTSGASPAKTNFTMAKVGKPNVTGVDVTPFVNVPQPVSQSSFLDSTASFAAVAITGALQSNTNTGIYSYDSSTGVYTFLKDANVNLHASFQAAGAATIAPTIFVDGVIKSIANSVATINFRTVASYSGEVFAGQTVSFSNATNTTNYQRIAVLATALSDQILTAPDTFSTDTAPLVYAGSGTYTLATLNTAPVGTFITYTYTATSDTRVQTTTAPTQTTSAMNTDGIFLTPRAFNATGTAATPATFLIQIGKGLLGYTPSSFAAAGKTTPFNHNVFGSTAGSAEYGVVTNYDPLTGILTLDSGVNFSVSSTSRHAGIALITGSSQTTGYMTVTASKNPALTGLGLGTVAAVYTSTSGQAIGTGITALTYETVESDTHSAYSGGIYTIPESGQYSINALYGTASVALTTANNVIMYVYIDGVLYSQTFVKGGTTTTYSVTGSISKYLTKGQTVAIRGACSVATTMNTSSTSNKFSITKTNVG